jgi:Holliday junction resolvasome RuvABC endonuclease subunit
MNIIAFDIARVTGVAIMRTDLDEISLGTIELPGKRGRNKIQHSETFLVFNNEVVEMLDLVRPGAIAFEDLAINAHSVRYMSGDWIRLYCGLRAILLMQAESAKVSWLPITVQQIKKRATGNGNAKKDEVLEAAKNMWPKYDITDHNEADACWCALVARDILAGAG